MIDGFNNASNTMSHIVDDMQMQQADRSKVIEIIDLTQRVIDANDSDEIIQYLKQISWRASEISVVLKYRNEHAKRIIKEADWACIERLSYVLVNDSNAVIEDLEALKADMQQLQDLLRKIYLPADLLPADKIRDLFSFLQKKIAEEKKAGSNIACEKVKSLTIDFLNKEKYFQEDVMLSNDEKINILSQNLISRIYLTAMPFIKKIVAQKFDPILLAKIISYVEMLEANFNVELLEHRLCLLRTLEVIGEASKSIDRTTKNNFTSIPWIDIKFEEYLLNLLNNDPNIVAELYCYDTNQLRIMRDCIHHPGEEGSPRRAIYNAVLKGERGSLEIISNELIHLKNTLSGNNNLPCDYNHLTQLATDLWGASEVVPVNIEQDTINSLLASLPYKKRKELAKKILKYMVEEKKGAAIPTEDEFEYIGIDKSVSYSLMYGNLSDAEKLVEIKSFPALKCNFVKRILETILEKKSAVALMPQDDLAFFLAQSGLSLAEIELWKTNEIKLREFCDNKVLIRQEQSNLPEGEEQEYIDELTKQLIGTRYNEVINLLKNTLKSISHNAFNDIRQTITDEEEVCFKTIYAKFEDCLKKQIGFGCDQDFIKTLKFLEISDEDISIFTDVSSALNAPKITNDVLEALNIALNDTDVILQELAADLNAVLPEGGLSTIDLVENEDFKKIIATTNCLPTDLKKLPKLMPKLFKIERRTSKIGGIKTEQITSIKYDGSVLERSKGELRVYINQKKELPEKTDDLKVLLNCFVSNENFKKWAEALDSLSKKMFTDLQIHYFLLNIPYYCHNYLLAVLNKQQNKNFSGRSDFIYALEKLGVYFYQDLVSWLSIYNQLNNTLSFESQSASLIKNLEDLTLHMKGNELSLDNLSKPRLIAEFYMDKIFRQVETLFEQPELSLDFKDSVNLAALFRLKRLRDDLAHRFFNIDSDLLVHEIYYLLMFQKTDFIGRLQEFKKNNYQLQSKQKIFLNHKITITPFDGEKEVYINRQALFDAFSEFGCNQSKVYCIGKLANSEVGIQSDINFLLSENVDEKTIAALFTRLQEIFGSHVAVVTQAKLDSLIGKVIDKHDKERIISSSKPLIQFLNIVRYKQLYLQNPQRLFYFNNEPGLRAINNINELDKITGLGPFWENSFPLSNRSIFESFMLDINFQKVFNEEVVAQQQQLADLISITLKPLANPAEKLDAVIEWSQLMNRISLAIFRVISKTAEAREVFEGVIEQLKVWVDNKLLSQHQEHFSKEIAKKCLENSNLKADEIERLLGNNSSVYDAMNRWHDIYTGSLKNILPAKINELFAFSRGIITLSTKAKEVISSYLNNDMESFKHGIEQACFDLMLISTNFSNHLMNKFHCLYKEALDVNNKTYDVSLKENKFPPYSFMCKLTEENLSKIWLFGMKIKSQTIISQFFEKRIIEESNVTERTELEIKKHYPFSRENLLMYLKKIIEIDSKIENFNNLNQTPTHANSNFDILLDSYIFILNISSQISIYMKENSALQADIIRLESYKSKNMDNEVFYVAKIEAESTKINDNNLKINGYLSHSLLDKVSNFIITKFLFEPQQKIVIMDIYNELRKSKTFDFYRFPQEIPFLLSFFKKELHLQLKNNIKAHAEFYINNNLSVDANVICLHGRSDVYDSTKAEQFMIYNKVKSADEIVRSLENFFSQKSDLKAPSNKSMIY